MIPWRVFGFARKGNLEAHNLNSGLGPLAALNYTSHSLVHFEGIINLHLFASCDAMTPKKSTFVHKKPL